MDSEEAAHASAIQKHNKYMVFGKKHRYIEVIQCSGDDMNLVLNGGLHSPANPTKSPLLSPGMLPQAQQATQSLPSPGLQINVPPPLTLSIPPPHSHTPNTAALLAQQQAQFIAQQNLLARQQANAVAVANHTAHTQSNDQSQYLLPNYALLPSLAGVHHGGGHAHLMQPSPAQTPNNIGNVAATSTMTPSVQSPFFFMQRPSIHPSVAASHLTQHQLNQMFPMGFMSTQYTHPALSLLPSHHHIALQQKALNQNQHAHATVHHHGHPSNPSQTQQSLMNSSLVAAATAASNHHYQTVANNSLMHAASIKRSYESAFQIDPSSSAAVAANASKRFFTRHPTNIYSPFYPPNL